MSKENNNPAGPVVPDLVKDTPILKDTPRVEPSAEPKVSFTPEQQAKIDEIVKAAMGRAAFETRSELARTKKALEQALAAASPDATEADKLRAQLDAARLRLDDLAQEHSRERLENTILAKAASARFVDPNQAALLLDKVDLLDADGAPDSAKIAAAVQSLADRSPWLVKGEVKPGSGSSPAQSVPADAPKLEELFGRGSNAKKCNELAIKNPSLYRTLRAQALRKGLVA